MENLFKKKTEKVEEEKNEDKSILKKIREIPNLEKSLIIAGLIEAGVVIKSKVDDIKPNKENIENVPHSIPLPIIPNKISELYEADNYSLKNETKKGLSYFLSEDFIKKVAISDNISKYSDVDLIKIKNDLIYKDSVNIDGVIYSIDKNSNAYFDKLSEIESTINGFEKFLEKDDIERAKNKIITIFLLIEKAKLEVLKHIGSNEYLEKLSREMNISKEIARKHQEVRINNIKNISCELRSGSEIEGIGGGYAYYLSGTNEICLPYDISLEDINQKDFFYEALLHEIFHEGTQFEEGMSNKSKDLLLDSHKYSNSDRNTKDSAYYFKPGELIVRKQILDLEMEKLGIKKYGEKFTGEHYKKLLEAKKEGLLSTDAIEFIRHIKPEKFSEVMNELADMDDNGKKYYHPGWDYDNPENTT